MGRFAPCDAAERQLQVADAPGQALAGLTKESDGGGTEQQELAERLASADALVDGAAQHGKQLRRSVYLVENNQAPALRLKIGERVRQTLQVGRAFEIEVPSRLADTPAGRLGDGPCQRRLAHLTGPQQPHGGKQPQVVAHPARQPARYGLQHGCNCGTSCRNYKVSLVPTDIGCPAFGSGTRGATAWRPSANTSTTERSTKSQTVRATLSVDGAGRRLLKSGWRSYGEFGACRWPGLDLTTVLHANRHTGLELCRDRRVQGVAASSSRPVDL